MLHVADAVKSGIQKIMIRTVDTDVVVIAVSAVHKLNITSLWMAFGVGKNFRYIPVLFMGPSKSNALLFFHAFSRFIVFESWKENFIGHMVIL